MDSFDLVIDSMLGMFEGFLRHLPQLMFALVVVFVGWLAARIVDRIIVRIGKEKTEHRSLRLFFRKMAGFLVWSLTIVLSAIVVFPSIQPADLLAGLGLGSVAIGFAFKDIFENFIAGMLILLREPFSLGDFVQCQNHEGWVEEITIRDTRIRQTDGQPVIVPNAMLFKNPVEVRTDKDLRRTTIMCGIAYKENVDEVREVITSAVDSVESVRSNEPIQVFAHKFGSSSIDFEVTWWTGSNPLDIRKSRDDVISAIKNRLDRDGIEIPFPYQTMTFPEPLRILSEAN